TRHASWPLHPAEVACPRRTHSIIGGKPCLGSVWLSRPLPGRRQLALSRTRRERRCVVRLLAAWRALGRATGSGRSDECKPCEHRVPEMIHVRRHIQLAAVTLFSVVIQVSIAGATDEELKRSIDVYRDRYGVTSPHAPFAT